MIRNLFGSTEDYVVSGNCGKEYTEELKKLKKQLKAEGRQVETIIVLEAIVLTVPIKKKED